MEHDEPPPQTMEHNEPSVTHAPANQNSQWLVSAYYINARSIVNKLDKFQSLTYASSFDIIGVTETWLTNEIFDNEIILPSCYILFHKDRPSHGGGVLLAIIYYQ